jgi:hypothetical protein
LLKARGEQTELLGGKAVARAQSGNPVVIGKICLDYRAGIEIPHRALELLGEQGFRSVLFQRAPITITWDTLLQSIVYAAHLFIPLILGGSFS